MKIADFFLSLHKLTFRIMKKNLFLMLLMLVPLVCFSARKQESVKLRWGTFNIRLQNDGDDKAGYGWNVRRDRVADYIKSHKIDVIGMQEVLHAHFTHSNIIIPITYFTGIMNNFPVSHIDTVMPI